jgi:hypothetical protein
MNPALKVNSFTSTTVLVEAGFDIPVKLHWPKPGSRPETLPESLFTPFSPFKISTHFPAPPPLYRLPPTRYTQN